MSVRHETEPVATSHEPRADRRIVGEIDDEFRTMIHDGAAEHDLERYARTRSPSIRDDGLRKALAGVTTLEEVLRVTRSD